FGGNDYNLSNSNTVKVVNEGFLTSFPWNITGTLTIPTTHSLGQYTGGSLAGTVWMELQNVRFDKNPETGATNNAYLVTNNQLGLIQTGHSNGQATADECKVFANTLFYLKQLTSKTSVRDNSFYDETAPEKPSVDMSLSEYNKSSYSLSFDVSAKDFGTTYKYRTEAIPKSSSSENVLSNTVVSEAFADMKGFVVIETNSPDSALEQIKYEDDGKTISNVIPATEGKITYNMNDLKKNKKYYLHIFAVDNENNISEEYVKEIYDNEEIISQADINSTLICDKSMYSPGDNAMLTATAYTTGTSLNATANIQLCDLDGNAISTVANDIKTQLSSVAKWSEAYSCSLNGLTIGRYMAIITWYVADIPVAQSKCMIKIGEQSEVDPITLKADVKQGTDYSNTLNWNDINEYTDEINIPTDFSIVVDVSGSMSGNRITNAKKAIDKFIDMLNPGDRISIVKFESKASLVCDFTDDKTALKDYTSKLSANGGTSVKSGLDMSVNTFTTNNNTADNYNKVIILICDGDVNNCNSAINKAIENNISINTVNVLNANVSALQNMSSQTGGKYYYSNVVSDMTEILQSINIMNHGGQYYYQIQRDSEIIDAVTNTEYIDPNFIDKASPEFSTVDFTATTL
ncbi:MAG: VWA domain-containing protein, partial [Clostridia bacterium]|nr:VWA domain-containing protein [Clostridia bacterium]